MPGSEVRKVIHVERTAGPQKAGSIHEQRNQ